MAKFLVGSSLFLVALFCMGQQAHNETKTQHKVYVMLGFHTSFYHSWRGDTNDEAGFGTDIRVVRGILAQLNDANAKGLDAKGYWDFDEYFTVEQILPKYAPDIIEGIRKRVASGLDEVLPGPYNNGITSAQTAEELYKTLAWALENPRGSGLKQVFGRVTPIYRPQEAMSTPGIIPIMQRAGIEGIILPYSAYPFTAFSNFVKPLPPEQRYGALWLKHETGPERTALIPCYSPGDALNYGSFELWMRHLRSLQEKGIVKSDLLLHYNFDADAETWLPMKLPYGLKNVPNTGGVAEIINAVNKYKWASFTTPAAYLKDHPPTGEIVIRQDTADGAFDGYFSWAEKFESHVTWTAIEQSRMYSYRAKALGAKFDIPLDRMLWDDRDSSLWYRILSLSTTHFGMSTPIINEERQAQADNLSKKARDLAYDAYRAIQSRRMTGHIGEGGDYSFTVYNYPRGEDPQGAASRMAVRIPIIIKGPGKPILKRGDGREIPASLINVEKLPDGRYAAELTFVADMDAQESRSYDLKIENSQCQINLSVSPSQEQQVQTIESFDMDTCVTYRTKKKPQRYCVRYFWPQELANECLNGVNRVKWPVPISFDAPDGRHEVKGSYKFTLYDDLPQYLIVDVDVDYPYTPPRDLIHTVQQKLRRYLDLRWIEVGPFAIHPDITTPESDPLTIWKHNYLGVTSSYSLNYGQINPKNREIDSFNHQITNGWVAVTNGKKGLLIAQDASVNASFAFAPMRLRVKNGMQQLYINPFGTYFGRQLDYTHLNKSRVGSQMTEAVAAHLRPSGPSFNGKHEKFRLLLAPYIGNKPPQELQNDAMAFFYPYGVIYHKTPFGNEIVTPEDMERKIRQMKLDQLMKSADPLPAPTALLANPAEGAVDLVWDIPRDERITGFDVRWRALNDSDWKEARIGLDRRYHIGDLTNGLIYDFSARSISGDRAGEWAPDVEGIPGAVGEAKLSQQAGNIPPSLIFGLAGKIIKHMILIH